jgi:hypothetical protein
LRWSAVVLPVRERLRFVMCGPDGATGFIYQSALKQGERLQLGGAAIYARRQAAQRVQNHKPYLKHLNLLNQSPPPVLVIEP